MILETNTPASDDDLDKDHRRLSLLNDPNYGAILAFLDKFGGTLDLPPYPLQLLEDHLVNSTEPNPSRLIDFHFFLLRRLSLAKNAQREKFDSVISKFAARFTSTENESLSTGGYLQADLHLKVQILKNLLESQFDSPVKTMLTEQSACEIRSTPLGRDRFGASYWLFQDNDGFVRLFREQADVDRTWTNLAKNRDELHKFLQFLVTDAAVRLRFPDWTIEDAQFAALLPTNDFEQYYSYRGMETHDSDTPAEEEPSRLKQKPPKRKRGRSQRWTKRRAKKTSTEGDSSQLTIEAPREDVIDEIQPDENSLDDMSLALRRSSRTRKISLPVRIDQRSVALMEAFQTPESTPNKASSTPRKPPPVRRARRKRVVRRNSDDYLCLPTSSSEELSEEEDLEDAPPEPDDHFFELDEDVAGPDDHQLRPAKTAQTSTTITACNVCANSDRPEWLLLCDGCNDAYHLECLRPVLLSVPDGDWYCPLCEQKQLTEHLLVQLSEFDGNWAIAEAKRQARSSKISSPRKTKLKDYSSDESITASESDNNDDSMLSTSQINENSNLSSCCVDDEKSSISQRGRHRRTRFDIKKMFDDEDTERAEFDLQLPKKITQLLHRQERSLARNDAPWRPISARLGGTPNYADANGSVRPSRSTVTSARQTLRIVRRWNDVRRRSLLKTARLKPHRPAGASEYIEDNSAIDADDASIPYSNDSNSNSGAKDDEDRAAIAPAERYSPRNVTKKSHANFDRLTRDIQIAVNEAHFVPATARATDLQPVKRLQKGKFSPYLSKPPLPLPQLPHDASDAFKFNESSSTPVTVSPDRQREHS